jgi:hypothetical protein
VEKRSRPSGNVTEMPPSRNLGVGNASCGGHDGKAGGDPLKRIVASGARKERLRQREFQRSAGGIGGPQGPPRKSARPPAYAELRVASAFSFLDGASLPEDLIEQAARCEIPAVALVDRNGVYGAPRFYKAAKAAGIKALVGAEVTLRQQSHPEERSDGPTTRGRPAAVGDADRRSAATIPGSTSSGSFPAQDDGSGLPR